MHMVESNNKAMTYLTQIKAFLDAHPQEVVVLFTSYHGDQSSTGTKQYPNTPVSVKQAFWRQIVDLFDGGKLLFDGAAGRLVNETSVGDLVKMGQRVVLYASDWAEFTGSDSRAQDAGKYFFNGGDGDSVFNLTDSALSWERFFQSTDDRRATFKAANTFYLDSLAGAVDSTVTEWRAEITFSPLSIMKKPIIKKCAAKFNIPGMTDFCPMSLLEVERLRNYYIQRQMDKVSE